MALRDIADPKGNFWFVNNFRQLSEEEAGRPQYKGRIIPREPEKTIIEKQLHPCPKYGEYDLLHEHRGQFIEFSLWLKGDKKDNSFLRVHRQSILNADNFYQENEEALKSLLQEAHHAK